MTSASDEKWRSFNCFFQSREQVVVRWGQIRRIGWVIKTMEAQEGQFLLGCKCPMNRAIVVQEQDPLGDLTVAFFLQNILQLHQQRWVILRVASLALWKIINEEDAVLIPKKSRRELSHKITSVQSSPTPESALFWSEGAYLTPNKSGPTLFALDAFYIPSMCRSSKWCLSYGFPHQNPESICHFPHTRHMLRHLHINLSQVTYTEIRW